MTAYVCESSYCSKTSNIHCSVYALQRLSHSLHLRPAGSMDRASAFGNFFPKDRIKLKVLGSSPRWVGFARDTSPVDRPLAFWQSVSSLFGSDIS